jgi:hypothetical protein
VEITCRNPTQIESRLECVEALRSPCPLRQDRRGEANAFAGFRRSTVARFWFVHFDRANPSPNRSCRCMSVTNDTLAAVRKPKIGVQSEECVEFDFYGLCDQPGTPHRRFSISGPSISSFCRR